MVQLAQGLLGSYVEERRRHSMLRESASQDPASSWPDGNCFMVPYDVSRWFFETWERLWIKSQQLGKRPRGSGDSQKRWRATIWLRARRGTLHVARPSCSEMKPEHPGVCDMLLTSR